MRPPRPPRAPGSETAVALSWSRCPNYLSAVFDLVNSWSDVKRACARSAANGVHEEELTRTVTTGREHAHNGPRGDSHRYARATVTPRNPLKSLAFAPCEWHVDWNRSRLHSFRGGGGGNGEKPRQPAQ